MTSNDCNRWATLSDRLALEEKLTFEELSFVSAHGKSCVACAAESELFDTMRACLVEDSSTVFLHTGSVARRPSSSRSRFLGVGIAGLATAAAVLFVLTGRYDNSPLNSAADRGVATPAAVPSAHGPASASNQQNAVELVMVAGEVAVSGADRSAGTSLKQGAVISTKQGRVCLSQVRSATLCLEPSSELEVTAIANTGDARGQGTTNEQGVELIKGTLSCMLDSESKAPFLVQTKWGTIRGWGAKFVVGYMDSGEAFLRLHEGRIQVGQKGGRSSDAEGRQAFRLGKTLEKVSLEKERFEEDENALGSMSVWADTGLSLIEIQSEPASSRVAWDGRVVGRAPVSMMVTPGEHQLEVSLDGYMKVERTFAVEGTERIAQTFVLAPEQASPHEGPRALLQRAQALRSKGEYARASTAYEQLIRSYPGSGEGRTALVSLGELSLSQLGAPQKALSSFERYLSGGGPLSQEASYGQIRALRALGREGEARSLGRKFVARYPDSAQAVSLRQWL